jgi:hypothetical protein
VVISRRGRKQRRGEIWVELPGGEQRTIPIEWTDQAGDRPYPEGVCFPIEKLLELVKVLGEIEEEQRRSIMAEGEGGRSHDTERDCELARNAVGEAPADHRGVGGDTDTGSSGNRKSRGSK